MEDLWFFSPNTKFRRCSRPHGRLRAFCRQHVPDRFHTSFNPLTSSNGCQAALQSSLLNFNFLRPSSRQEELAPLEPPGPAISGTSNNWPRPYARHYARHASTEEHPHLLRRLWEKRRSAHAALKSDDLPPRPSFLADTGGTPLGRTKAGKAANELRLRCTEINENGDVTLVNGEFRKSELIAKVEKATLHSIG